MTGRKEEIPIINDITSALIGNTLIVSSSCLARIKGCVISNNSEYDETLYATQSFWERISTKYSEGDTKNVPAKLLMVLKRVIYEPP